MKGENLLAMEKMTRMGSRFLFGAHTWVAGSIFLATALSTQAQLTILPNQIQFRTHSTAANTTIHYGNLELQGGSAGNAYGKLQANGADFYGNTQVIGGLLVYGRISSVSGLKNFVQPHPTDSTKAIRYVSIESGEALTVTRGLARTSSGTAEVNLPEDFSLVTSEKGPLTVLLTVEGVPALAYVKSKSKESIIVELKESDFRDYGDVDFSYQVTGVRDGFENQIPIVSMEEIATPKASAEDNLGQKRMKAFSDRIQKVAGCAKGKR